MSLEGCQRNGSSYRVEVSGWDRTRTFFVEKSELRCDQKVGQQIRLRRSLHPGTMIFVRLLLPFLSERATSVAYRAEQISVTPEGEFDFRLDRVQTKSARELV
jgi:hypothetical protein